MWCCADKSPPLMLRNIVHVIIVCVCTIYVAIFIQGMLKFHHSQSKHHSRLLQDILLYIKFKVLLRINSKKLGKLL